MRSALIKTCPRTVRGYTLIEMAIVLIVLGLMGSSFIAAYRVYAVNQIKMKTELHSSIIVSALGNFLIQNGRYPCPARMTATRSDADYGIETECDSTSPDYPFASNPGPGTPGTSVAGLWFEQSPGVVDIDPGPGITNLSPKVRRGSIPFRTLGLAEERSEDGYGNRFHYAVTERLAVTATYLKNNGGILVHNSQDQPYFPAKVRVKLRPDGTTQFLNVTGNHNQINEAIPNDANYAWVSNGNVPQFRMTLSNSPLSPDYTGTGRINFRLARSNSGVITTTGNNPTNAFVSLEEGGVEIFNSGSVGNLGNWAQYSYTFPMSSVTNIDNVVLRFHHAASGGTVANRRGGAISWVEVDIPANDGYMHYFLFSSGKDQAGAYTRYGKEVYPCPTGRLDTQNCNTTAQAIYRYAEYSEAETSQHFDDTVKFFISVETPLWRVSGTSAAHIRDLLGAELAGRRIGIGQDPNMADTAVVQVGGEVRAHSASAMVSEVCDPAKINCFSPEKFARNDPDFECSAATGGSFAIGFEGGKIRCSDTQRVGCLPGQFVTGVQPDGTVECTSVVGCPPKDLVLCGVTNHTIPAGVQGQIYTTPVAGYNYTETWQCGPNPWWQLSSSAGICNCTPVDETYPAACPNPNGGFYTGSITYHHVHTCPDDNDTVTEVSNTCLCDNDGATQQYTDFAGCAAGFTGSIIYDQTWTCISPTVGQWSTPVVAPGGNNCTCNASSQTQNLSCPTAYAGTWIQQRDFECPAGTWTNWYDTTNTCACQDGLRQTQNAACDGSQAGWTGYKVQERFYSCATNTWSAWADAPGENFCSCTPTTQTQTLSCQTAYSGGVTQERQFTCPAASWNAWTTTANTCSCTGASESRTVACDAPLVGTKSQQRDYNCGTDTWGSWYDTNTDNCAAVTYSWVPKTPADGPYASGLTYKSGNTCSSPGDRQPCSALAGGGLGHWHYAECQCE